jgi:hypothetical protein
VLKAVADAMPLLLIERFVLGGFHPSIVPAHLFSLLHYGLLSAAVVLLHYPCLAARLELFENVGHWSQRVMEVLLTVYQRIRFIGYLRFDARLVV